MLYIITWCMVIYKINVCVRLCILQKPIVHRFYTAIVKYKLELHPISMARHANSISCLIMYAYDVSYQSRLPFVNYSVITIHVYNNMSIL